MYTTIINAAEYKGYPLTPDVTGYVGVYLDDAIDTVKKAMSGNTNIITCHVLIDIRSAYLGGLVIDSGSRVARMIDILREQVEKAQISQSNGAEITRKASIEAIWKTILYRKYACAHQLVLLLNTEAYFNQHASRSPEQVVKDRILMAWCEVNNLSLVKGFSQITYPENAFNSIQANERGMKEILPMIDFLCTRSDTTNGIVFSPFGTTKRTEINSGNMKATKKITGEFPRYRIA